MKIYAFGNFTIDTIVESVKELPAWGTEIFVNNIIKRSGGNLANFSFTLKKLGIEPILIGNIGDDDYGKEILKSLKDFSISTALIKTENKTNTSLSITILREDGERLFLTTPGQLSLMNKSFIQNCIDIVDEYSYFILCNLFQLPNLLISDLIEFFKLLKEKKCTIFLDPGWDTSNWQSTNSLEIKFLLKYIDFFLPNYDEAKAITKLNNDTKILEKFKDFGANNIVIKKGSLGSIAILNNKLYSAPAHSVNCLDATGAGDAFNAAIIYCLIKKFPVKDMLNFSNMVSAYIISKLTNRFPTIDDLKNF